MTKIGLKFRLAEVILEALITRVLEKFGWRLETLVYIELLRSNRPIGQDIFYFRNEKGIETDFVVCKGNKALALYQVCYDLSNEKTRR